MIELTYYTRFAFLENLAKAPHKKLVATDLAIQNILNTH